MNSQAGFTLIEIVVFIVITSILAATLLLTFTTSLQKAPQFIQNLTALESAKKCMEWFIGQRSLLGYNSIACPSSAVPGFCTTPSGYTLSVAISCASIGGDASYKIITVSMSGITTLTLTTMIADYE